MSNILQGGGTNPYRKAILFDKYLKKQQRILKPL